MVSLTQVGQDFSVEGYRPSQGGGWSAAEGSSRQEINFDEAFRALSRFAEDIRAVYANHQSDPAGERVRDVVTE